MAFTTHLLVVANRTVDSPELLDALKERAQRGPIHVTLLAPTTWSERGTTRRPRSPVSRRPISAAETSAPTRPPIPIANQIRPTWRTSSPVV